MPLRGGGCRLLARWSDPLPGDSFLPQPPCDSDFLARAIYYRFFLADKPFRGGGGNFILRGASRSHAAESPSRCLRRLCFVGTPPSRARRAHARARGGREPKELCGGCSGRDNHQGTLRGRRGRRRRRRRGVSISAAPKGKGRGGDAAATAQRVAFESTRATISAATPASSGGKRQKQRFEDGSRPRPPRRTGRRRSNTRGRRERCVRATAATAAVATSSSFGGERRWATAERISRLASASALTAANWIVTPALVSNARSAASAAPNTCYARRSERTRRNAPASDRQRSQVPMVGRYARTPSPQPGGQGGRARRLNELHIAERGLQSAAWGNSRCWRR